VFWYIILSFVYSSFSLSFPVFYSYELMQYFFFFVGNMAPIQIHAENSIVPPTIIKINGHFSVVSSLLIYSQVFCFLLYSRRVCFLYHTLNLLASLTHSRYFSFFSGFFATFNSNKIYKLKMYPIWLVENSIKYR
jgi:hypothetical protein